LGISKKTLSKNGNWLLFSVCATPIHVWTLILFFRDFSWISERTNSLDAIGVGSYGLLIAFIESVFIFILAFVLSYIFPQKWSESQKVALLGVLIFLIAAWTIVGQLYFLFEVKIPNFLLLAIARNPHPLWILYGGLSTFVGLTVGLPAFCIFKFGRFRKGIINIFERLTTLTAFYLFLDLCGLIVVIVRNI
jgi:hypothetical protein